MFDFHKIHLKKINIEINKNPYLKKIGKTRYNLDFLIWISYGVLCENNHLHYFDCTSRDYRARAKADPFSLSQLINIQKRTFFVSKSNNFFFLFDFLVVQIISSFFLRHKNKLEIIESHSYFGLNCKSQTPT